MTRRSRIRSPLLGALIACGSAACSSSADLSPLAQQGQRVYQNVCIACHNGDPTQDGSAGPAIAGSSRELVEARVLHASYPPGYTPKRQSNAMPRFGTCRIRSTPSPPTSPRCLSEAGIRGCPYRMISISA